MGRASERLATLLRALDDADELIDLLHDLALMRQPLVTLLLNLFIKSIITPEGVEAARIHMWQAGLAERVASVRLDRNLPLRMGGRLGRSRLLHIIGLGEAAIVQAVTSF